MTTDTTATAPADTSVTPPVDAALPATNDATVNTEGEDANDPSRDKLIRKLERRIDARTRGLGERDTTIAQLRAELATARASRDDDTDDTDKPKPRTVPEEEVETRANARAAELRRIEKIAEKARAAGEAGKKLNSKFAALVNDMAEDIPLVDSKGRPTEFSEAVLDCDDKAAVMLAIASDPDLIEEFKGLSGAALGRRIARLETELAKSPATPSGAPKPLTPVGGRGNSGKAEAAMSDEEWRASRQAARRAA